MNIIYNISNEVTFVIYKLNQNDITRCPHCNLICSFKLNFKEGNPMIDYECENEHKGNIYLKKYMNVFNKYSLLNEKCKDCGKNKKEIKGDFFSFSKCNICICDLCQLNHPNEYKHNMFL